MSTKSHQKCPRKVTQKEDISWTFCSTRCRQKCPRDVTPFVHEMSPIMSTKCLPPSENLRRTAIPTSLGPKFWQLWIYKLDHIILNSTILPPLIVSHRGHIAIVDYSDMGLSSLLLWLQLYCCCYTITTLTQNQFKMEQLCWHCIHDAIFLDSSFLQPKG